jgi:hypothetical protein
MLPDFERVDRIGETLDLPREPWLRRAPDRLRGGSDAPGGAGGDVAGGQALTPFDGVTRAESYFMVPA